MPMETTPPVNDLAAATPLAVVPRLAPSGVDRGGGGDPLAPASASAGDRPRLGFGSILATSAVGLRFYRRILSYFTSDWALIATLVALIWVALLAGVLEGAAYMVVV